MVFCLRTYTDLAAQSASQAITFINGKSNSGAHVLSSPPDESSTWSEITKSGDVVQIVTVYKDIQTKEAYNKPQKFVSVCNLKYLNPINVNVKYYNKNIFFIELSTTNGERKVKADYYGQPKMINYIMFGPYDITDETELDVRLKKAFLVAITQFGGKPDTF